LREEFCIPSDNERFHVLKGDGIDYVEDDNLIVLAFRTDNAIRNWARRERLAHTLEKRFGLSFPRYVHKMKRSPKVTALHALT
jgi:hypothetical protein